MKPSSSPEAGIEVPSDTHLAEALIKHGLEHTETRVMLIAWTEDQEARVDQFDDTSPERARAHVEFEMRRAKLYLSAGYKEVALESFQDAQSLARGYHLEAFCVIIKAEIDNITQS